MVANIYGIHGKVCGIYIIKCKINNRKYIGSSTDISSRLSTHFGRECKLYPYKPLYIDIIKYGRDNFTWKILEECNKMDLHDREQYWYDVITPSPSAVTIVRESSQTCFSRPVPTIGASL